MSPEDRLASLGVRKLPPLDGVVIPPPRKKNGAKRQDAGEEPPPRAAEAPPSRPPAAPIRSEPPRFKLEPWREITFKASDEWLVKRVLPRRGLAAIYGKPGSLKSFVAFNIALCVALGLDWAGRRTRKAAALYIAAEGAAGLRKRKAGYVKAWCDSLPADVDFALVSAAPNLGADPGDLPALTQAIEASGIKPGVIVIDTLAKTIGGADENGTGMTAFVANAGELAQRFDCLVLVVHHVGLDIDAQKRMRGHSSFHGALDAQMLCERREGENRSTLTIQKLKDDADAIRLEARLSRVVVGYDDEGDEASTLIVDEVTDAETKASEPKSKTIPAGQLLLWDTITNAIGEAGERVPSFPDGPMVQAVSEEVVREGYYAAIAEKAAPDDIPDKVAERKRKAFNRAVKAMLDAKRIAAREILGRRMLWLL